MNDFKDLLSIGEVSKMCRISVKALRHYDKLGIVKPAYTDPANKYRYYNKNQLPFIVFIREMRLKGFTLSEILSCFVIENKEKVFKYEKVVTLVDEKLAQVSEQLEKLLKVQQQYLSMKETHMETGLSSDIQSDEIKIKNIPPRPVAFTRYRSKYEFNEMNARVTELIHLIHGNNLYHKGYPMTIFYEGVLESDIEVCWEVMPEKPFEYPFIREIPAGLYASVIHRGDYDILITETYARLKKWIKANSYRITGPPIWIYVVSIPNSRDRSKFITEVQVPVIKK